MSVQESVDRDKGQNVLDTVIVSSYNKAKPRRQKAQMTSKKTGFTLIELLVVITIISILAAILFPVFAQAREKSRQIACISNLRQLSLAFLQYEQDNDESFPLVCYTTGIGTTELSSWTITLQPYIKSQGILRCPDDNSNLWGTDTRYSSYAMNAWMTPNAPKEYKILSQIALPASVIYLTENASTSTVDHFPPYCWNTNDPIYAEEGMSNWCTSSLDASGHPTSALAWNLHQGGFNSMFVDGHAKWNQWSRVWFQNTATGVYEGNFDPRQQ